jgi:hypothetical protein
MAHSNRGGKTFGVNDFYRSYIPVTSLMGKRVAKGSLLGTLFSNGDQVSAWLVATDDAGDIQVTLSNKPANGVREQAGTQRWFDLAPVIDAVLKGRREAWDGDGSRVAYDGETAALAQDLLLDYLNKVSAMWRFNKDAAEKALEDLAAGKSPFHQWYRW